MPITTEAIALVTHVLFAQQGTAFTLPAPGTVGPAAKPAADDSAWLDLGDVEEFTQTPELETFEKMGGRPGYLVRTDEVPLSSKRKFEWSTTDVTPIVHQPLFGTLPLTGGSDQGNPLEGPLLVKGWLKFQAYSGGTLKVLGDAWVSLRVQSADPWCGPSSSPTNCTTPSTRLASMPEFDNTQPASAPLASVPWADCVAALTSGLTDPTTLKADDELDSVTLALNGRFLCVGTRPDAGVYVVGASASARSTDANAAAEFKFGRQVKVTGGDTPENVGPWIHPTAGEVELGSTHLTFSRFVARSRDLSPSFDNTPPEESEL